MARANHDASRSAGASGALCDVPYLVVEADGGSSVIVATEGSVIRLYWMPALLCLDELRCQLFVQQLNAVGVCHSFGER